MLRKSPAIVAELLPSCHMIVTCCCSIRVVVLADCFSDSVFGLCGERGQLAERCSKEKEPHDTK